MSDLTGLSLEALSKAIRAGTVSPVEATEACLSTISARDGDLNSFVTVCGEAALSESRERADELARGGYCGPLHGVPLALKDLYATRGVRTTAGSGILRDWVPDFDATVVQRLRDAGAVLLGKVGMYEFAYGASSLNVHWGPVRNPHDASRTTGGSSSGSGAAVAAGMCYGSLGSDTGGSIRCPASFCGIVGLKPTYGRVSRHGAVPLAWSLDHVGPMTRTVADAALLLEAIAGHDPNDPNTLQGKVPSFRSEMEGDIRGLRLALPRQWLWEDVDPEVEATCRAAIRQLEAAGAIVDEVDVPCLEWVHAPQNLIIHAEASAYHRKRLLERPNHYSDTVRLRLAKGLYVTGSAYLDARRAQKLARREMAEALRRWDALLSPSVPFVAPTFEEIERNPAFQFVRNTFPFNLTGLPAISVPCGTAYGMPVGLQVAGRAWEEGLVLRVARAVEETSGPNPSVR